MKVYCTDTFRKAYNKLIKKSSYQSLGKLIIEEILQKPSSDLATSNVINGRENDLPFYKKRVGGSRGYRVYCMLLIAKDELYLAYTHPKTGSQGADNILPGYKDTLEDEIALAKINNDRFIVEADGNTLKFIPAPADEE